MSFNQGFTFQSQTGGGGESNDAANVGGGSAIFRDKVGVTLNFRSLVGVNGIATSVVGDTIEIDGSGIVATGEANTASNVGTGIGVFRQKTGVNLEFRSISTAAGSGLSSSTDGVTISLNANFGQLAGQVTEGNDTRLPSQSENDALLGTSGTPSSINRYVTDTDGRLPTVSEKAALAGTSGTPGGFNRYVTNSDARLTNARIPTGAAGGQLGGTYPNPDVRGLRETGGPTLLTMGAVDDGEVLVRQGTTLVGLAGGGILDEQVKITTNDITPGYLNDKLIGSGIIFTVLNPGADEDLQVSPDFGTGAGQVTQGNDTRIPSQPENDALQGTSGAPSNTNRYVTNDDTRLPTQSENDALLGSAGTPSGANRYLTQQEPNLPVAGEKAALAGTNGTPSGINRYVTETDPILPTQSENDALQGTAGIPSNTNRYVTNEDTRLPSQTENDALLGTSGTPSNTNRYVTDADPRNTNARAPTGPASGQLGGTYPGPDVRGIRETGGPTLLTVGVIADGQGIQRSGTTLTGVNLLQLTNTAPVNVTKAAAVVGVSAEAARSDHKHDISTAAPAAPIGTDTTNLEGVATTLSRSDHSHEVNLPVFQATATANTTNTSLNDVLMGGMSIGPGAGDFLVDFSTSVDNSNGQSVFISIYANGLQLAHTERSVDTFLANGNTFVVVSTTAVVTGLGAGQTIEIRWRVSGGTATARQRTLRLVRYG